MILANSNLETGLTHAEVASLQRKLGPNEVLEHPERNVLLFLKRFWGLSAWMIELVIIVSLILGKSIEASVALLLLLVNAVLGFIQERRSQLAVKSLKKHLFIKVKVRRDGRWLEVPARELVPGDVMRLRSGDFIPADARVLDGEIAVDQSMLTGESMEVERVPSDQLYSGSIVRRGEATCVASAIGLNTSFGKTTELVQSARPKLHIEAVVTNIVKVLFAVVGVMVLAAFIMSLRSSQNMAEVLPLSLVLLMGALPVALPAMFTITMALGAKELSGKGVLVTRLSASEDAAGMSVLCFDKTGTLTMNKLSLNRAMPSAGYDEDSVIRIASLASNEANRDPIDLAILEAAHERGIDITQAQCLRFIPFSAQTRRTESTVRINAEEFVITKGALETLKQICQNDANSSRVLEDQASRIANEGNRVIAVAQAHAKDRKFQMIGILSLADKVRPGSKALLDELQSLGIEVIMLTGDSVRVANAIASVLGLGKVTRLAEDKVENLGEWLIHESRPVLAQVFPEDKFKVVQALQRAGAVVGMTGDGVNDAPALKQAEVGIAVDSATDVARASASVVLTFGGLSGIVHLIKNGRKIYQRILTWIINKISRTILKTLFVTVAFFFSGQFVVSSLAMVLLLFMTDFAKLTLATDRVQGSKTPVTWDIKKFILTASLLGLIQAVEALTVLAVGWRYSELGAGELQTFGFLILLFFALFSLISVREHGPFWSSRPSWILLAVLALDAGLGILIGISGLFSMKPLAFGEIMLIFLTAAFLNLLLNDFIKVKTIKYLNGLNSMKV